MNNELTKGMNSDMLDWFVRAFVFKPEVRSISDMAGFEWHLLETEHAVIGKRMPHEITNYLDIHFHPDGEKYGPDIALLASAGDIEAWDRRGVKWAAICCEGATWFYKPEGMKEELEKTGDEMDIYHQPGWKERYLAYCVTDKTEIMKELGLPPE